MASFTSIRCGFLRAQETVGTSFNGLMDESNGFIHQQIEAVLTGFSVEVCILNYMQTATFPIKVVKSKKGDDKPDFDLEPDVAPGMDPKCLERALIVGYSGVGDTIACVVFRSPASPGRYRVGCMEGDFSPLMLAINKDPRSLPIRISLLRKLFEFAATPGATDTAAQGYKPCPGDVDGVEGYLCRIWCVRAAELARGLCELHRLQRFSVPAKLTGGLWKFCGAIGFTEKVVRGMSLFTGVVSINNLEAQKAARREFYSPE